MNPCGRLPRTERDLGIEICGAIRQLQRVCEVVVGRPGRREAREELVELALEARGEVACGTPAADLLVDLATYPVEVGLVAGFCVTRICVAGICVVGHAVS